MNFLEYFSLFGAITNLVLAVFVLVRNLRDPANRIYALLGIALCLWNLGTYNMFRATTREEAEFWAALLHLGVIFTPVLLFHLSLLIADLRFRKLLVAAYAFQFILVAAHWHGGFISGVRDVGYAWYSVAGPWFPVFFLPYSLAVFAVFVLIRKRRALPVIHRTRLTPLIFAQMALVVCGVNDLLPIIGIDLFPMTQIQIVPIGGIAAIFYGALTAYSVLQHQILDARITLGRTAAHAVRAGFLTLLAGALVLALGWITGTFGDGTNLAVSMVAFFLAAVAGSHFFPRLFGSGSERIERHLLGDRFEYHDKMRDFTESLGWQTDAAPMLEGLDDLLLKEVGVRGHQLLVFDEITKVFLPLRAQPPDPSPLVLARDAEVFRFFREEKAEILAAGFSYAPIVRSDLEKKALAELAGRPFEVCLPLAAGRVYHGLWLLDGKQRGDRFTNEDIDLLVSMARALGMVINQMRLREQVLLAREMELLGRMSRGIAHDLNNLLTPAWTFLQLAEHGPVAKEAQEELLPVAVRNLGTMRSYIRESLFFSENRKADLQELRLAEVWNHCAALAQPQLKIKSMRTLIEPESDGHVLADRLLLQRAFSNLISNAIDASEPGSLIHVGIHPAPGGGTRTTIRDEGEGISAENLAKIGTPYFTTKDTGDETRGFGLGVSICKRIVHLHGGQMNIASRPGLGTTVTIDLPPPAPSP